MRRFAPDVHTIAVGAYALPERDAEDVFQEVFVTTWTRLDELPRADDLHAWIVGATRAAAERRSESLIRR